MDITTYDPRTIRTDVMEYRQIRGDDPAIQIMHRRIGTKWWDLAYGRESHSQETWDGLLCAAVCAAGDVDCSADHLMAYIQQYIQLTPAEAERMRTLLAESQARVDHMRQAWHTVR